MSQSHNVEPQWRTAFFARMSFATTRRKTSTFVLAELKPIRQGRLRDMRKVDYANARACRDCPLRPRCTNNYRAVSRLENEDALDRMAARLGQRPDILARRREIVEHPFGTIKQWMNQGAFLMRGLDKVRAEFSLTALVYNLRRALNILGVARLMAAVAG